MDRLTAMEVFVKVVDCGGFTAAAAASDISVTMVSNHIQALEKHLGARLLNRTTRRHNLTEIGKTYYDQCIDILGRIDGAEIEAREMRAQPRGHLRISSPVTLGSHLLTPAFTDYLLQYPEVQIELMLNDRIVDLINDEFDLAFRFGEITDQGLVARPLRGLGLTVCASPEYLARHGTPRDQDDLSTHNCLAFHNVHPEREWRFDEPQKRIISVSGNLTINNGPALAMAALNGIGIVMLPNYLVASDIAANRLVPLFPEHKYSRAPLQLVYRPDRHMTPKMRSFIDYILATLG